MNPFACCTVADLGYLPAVLVLQRSLSKHDSAETPLYVLAMDEATSSWLERHPRPGLEVIHPMAVVILGGLVTSTFAALFLLPALYLRFGAGAPPAAADERELMERWLGVEPEPATAAAAAGTEEAGPRAADGPTPDGAGSSVAAEKETSS